MLAGRAGVKRRNDLPLYRVTGDLNGILERYARPIT